MGNVLDCCVGGPVDDSLDDDVARKVVEEKTEDTAEQAKQESTEKAKETSAEKSEESKTGGASTKPTLIYFVGLRARTESINMMAAYVGYDMDFEWVQFSEWGEMKPKMPGGQLPVLRRGESLKGESCDIALIVATEGKTVKDFNADENQQKIYKLSQDSEMSPCNPYLNFYPASKTKEDYKGWMEKCGPQMKDLLSTLEKSEGPWFGGKEPGMGDFGAYHLFSNIRALGRFMKEDPWAEINKNEKWSNWVKSFEALPRVDDYLKSRMKSKGEGWAKQESVIATTDVDEEWEVIA